MQTSRVDRIFLFFFVSVKYETFRFFYLQTPFVLQMFNIVDVLCLFCIKILFIETFICQLYLLLRWMKFLTDKI